MHDVFAKLDIESRVSGPFDVSEQPKQIRQGEGHLFIVNYVIYFVGQGNGGVQLVQVSEVPHDVFNVHLFRVLNG